MSHNNKLMRKCAVGYLYIRLLWATLFYPVLYLGLCVVFSPFLLFGKKVAKHIMLNFRKMSTFNYTFLHHRGYPWNFLETCFTIATVLFPLFSFILFLFMRIYNGLDIDTAILVYILVIFILVFIFEILFENYTRKEELDYLICDKPLKDKVFIVIAAFAVLIIFGVIDYIIIVYLLNL